jgi:isoleucyl-tRNA synthetase
MHTAVKDFNKTDNYTNYQVTVLNEKFTPEFKEAILNMNKDAKPFNFMDGPPFVTGNLHWGHLTIGALKSSILNFQRMNGKRCLNKMGYDTHGVPIESIVNSQLNIKSIEDLKTVGIEKFNQTCKESILNFQGEWEPIYNKLGRWTDFQNTYKTMDGNYMESTWWAFSELFKKNLVYRSHKVSAYSTPLQSPLSNFETQQNYKTKNTKSIYVKFLVNSENLENMYFIVWTTTPWTLPMNCALCVNPELEYGFYELQTNETYIMEKDTFKNAEIKGKLIKTMKGSELVGLSYQPPFNYMNSTLGSNAFKVVSDAYVTSSAESDVGTGIVHLAPAFGEDDYRVCMDKKVITDDDIQICCPINEDCIYNDTIEDFKGKFILDAEPDIIKYIKSKNLLQRIQMYSHEYPYCYRTDTPLIYRTINAVYIKVTDIKEKLLEMNSKITWNPANIGEKRFQNWLENVRDWCVSRSRYFGTPIPMWVAEDGEIKVIGSIAELEELVGNKLNLTDIHPEFVDSIKFTINGKVFSRIPDVFDCWFESGCVPYGQIHYPFENANYFDNMEYLSDFIVEGIDQTRGWFYTLLVLSTALLNKPAFKTVNVVGLVLDENGEKFSKKKKNYVDANLAIDSDGADVLRLYVMSSQLTHAEPLKFKQVEVLEVKQKVIQLINSVKFYVEHTINLEKKHQLIPNIMIIQDKTKLNENFLDGWIYEQINKLTFNVKKWMEAYNVSSAVNAIIDFVEDLTNYYIKLNRESLKGMQGIEEWQNSLGVLYNVFKMYLTVLAPFAPFLSEYLYMHIKQIDTSNLDSVHFYTFPTVNENIMKDLYFEPTFNILKRILKIVRAERHRNPTHTSQKTPILECKIRMDSDSTLSEIKEFIHLIHSELNCINLSYGTYDSELEYSIELNHRLLGQKFRGKANMIKEKLMVLSQDELSQLYHMSQFDKSDIKIIKIEQFDITPDMFTIKKVPKSGTNSIIDNDLMIQLDFTYNESIMLHHAVNCFVTYFQNHRKIIGLRPWDKVDLIVNCDEKNILKMHKDIFEKRTNVPVIFETSIESYREICTDGMFSYSDDITISYTIGMY